MQSEIECKICREKIEAFCSKLFNTEKNDVNQDTFESLANYGDLKKYRNTGYSKDRHREDMENRFSNYEELNDT